MPSDMPDQGLSLSTGSVIYFGTKSMLGKNPFCPEKKIYP